MFLFAGCLQFSTASMLKAMAKMERIGKNYSARIFFRIYHIFCYQVDKQTFIQLKIKCGSMADNVFHQYLTAAVANEVSPYGPILDIRVSDVKLKMALITEIEQIESSVRLFAAQYVAALVASIEPSVFPKVWAVHHIHREVNEINEKICSIIADAKVERLLYDLNCYSEQIKSKIVIFALEGNTSVIRPRAQIILKKKLLTKINRSDKTEMIRVRLIFNIIFGLSCQTF